MSESHTSVSEKPTPEMVRKTVFNTLGHAFDMCRKGFTRNSEPLFAGQEGWLEEISIQDGSIKFTPNTKHKSDTQVFQPFRDAWSKLDVPDKVMPDKKYCGAPNVLGYIDSTGQLVIVIMPNFKSGTSFDMNLLASGVDDVYLLPDDIIKGTMGRTIRDLNQEELTEITAIFSEVDRKLTFFENLKKDK